MLIVFYDSKIYIFFVRIKRLKGEKCDKKI